MNGPSTFYANDNHAQRVQEPAHTAPPPAAPTCRSFMVIPARLASTRLPRKLLLSETGKPLIQHTFEAAQRARRPVGLCVAADHEEIASAVRAFGGEVAYDEPRLRQWHGPCR